MAPYKVIRVNLDVDVTGYRPEKIKWMQMGGVPDRIFNKIDFDKNMVIDDRTQKKVAKYVSDILKDTNSRFDKSIFFCIDIEHASRMRQALVNENSDMILKDSRYVMKITGDDSEGRHN